LEELEGFLCLFKDEATSESIVIPCEDVEGFPLAVEFEEKVIE
jgi:hypothetical protein